MSKQIADINGLLVTSFYGGKKRGLCLQLTSPQPAIGYSQLNVKQVRELIAALQDWLGETELPFVLYNESEFNTKRC